MKYLSTVYVTYLGNALKEFEINCLCPFCPGKKYPSEFLCRNCTPPTEEEYTVYCDSVIPWM